MASLQCQFCGAPVTVSEPIGRDATCESCGHDLRCCRNCRHYDPHYNNACTETMADPVVEKDRRNFCEYFYFNRAAFKAAASTSGREAEARKKLEGMFGGSGAPAPPGDPRKKVEGLFGGAPGGDRAADARKKLDDLFKKPPTSSADES
jgi:hypothetical protein